MLLFEISRSRQRSEWVIDGDQATPAQTFVGLAGRIGLLQQKTQDLAHIERFVESEK